MGSATQTAIMLQNLCVRKTTTAPAATPQRTWRTTNDGSRRGSQTPDNACLSRINLCRFERRGVPTDGATLYYLAGAILEEFRLRPASGAWAGHERVIVTFSVHDQSVAGGVLHQSCLRPAVRGTKVAPPVGWRVALCSGYASRGHGGLGNPPAKLGGGGGPGLR